MKSQNFTSPTSYSHFTLGNPKSHFSTILFIRTSDYWRHLRIKRIVTVIMILPITPETMSSHYLVKCRTYSSGGRCIVSLQTLHGGSEKVSYVVWHWWRRAVKITVISCQNTKRFFTRLSDDKGRPINLLFFIYLFGPTVSTNLTCLPYYTKCK